MRETRTAKGILPLGLLVEGRKCLVVGGGVVAARKAQALAEARADVTMVAPELGEAARTLEAAAKVRILQREFLPGDLAPGVFLVFTATDDPALNRRILEQCRSLRILCACPDTGWENGDFLSPASFRHEDLTVSVSTGGASCRRSRLIKESLARHVKVLGQADLVVIGTDHRFADLPRRESLHLAGARRDQTAEMLRQILGVHEFMLLCTCNRVEFVGLAAATPAVMNSVERILGLDRLAGCAYRHQGPAAFRHLALVASGLLSQTPGETHICAQVKAALDASSLAGWSAGVLQHWVGRALHIGRILRQATQGDLAAVDVEDLCRDYLVRAWGGLKDRNVLVLGSGLLGRGVVERLAAGGARVACAYHATIPEFSGLAQGRVPVFPLSALRQRIRGQDAIVCAVRGEDPVLAAEQAAWLGVDFRGIVVDLGVPRNVGPDFTSRLPAATVVDLDALGAGRDVEAPDVRRALGTGERIVMEHMGDYERLMASIQAGDPGEPPGPGPGR